MNGAIAWFGNNPVAANLVMVFIIVSGLVAGTSIRAEVFAEIPLNRISIQVPYLGAAPEEVESGVVIRIEEAIQSIDGIKRIHATASEGLASVTAELDFSADARVLDELKNSIDAIPTLPLQTEEPIISEVIARTQVVDCRDIRQRRSALPQDARRARSCRVVGPAGGHAGRPLGRPAVRDLDRGFRSGAAPARDDIRPDRRGGATSVARPAGRLRANRRRGSPATHDGASLPRRGVRGSCVSSALGGKVAKPPFGAARSPNPHGRPRLSRRPTSPHSRGKPRNAAGKNER